MSDDTTSDDVERVERTDIGASVEARLKRGTGTRDEDKITIKAKGETAADALEEFEQLLAEYEAEYGDRMRTIQPRINEE
ncbi:DUF7389 domain-containing protein [Haloarcula nitratireducens]|uniref:DUF7389 domain-containing protein n=1 Tax=Haloarcula nitratireducens TaxID=2487749 RepID=A0AAW4PI30_9EURY|nr:hypothetical protein [Halomicroarcula nitratireducens]MBX0297639.1 hypothetical protein [Halomicroarcula nitratireducens]